MQVYERVDRPLIPVIGRMERRGVKVDRDYLAQLSKEFATEIASLEERVYEAAGLEEAKAPRAPAGRPEERHRLLRRRIRSLSPSQ